MLRCVYPKIVIDKVNRYLEAWSHLNIEEKEKTARETLELSHSYLRKVSCGTNWQPSSRTLVLLGYEVLVRDVETGETEILELKGVQWDTPTTSLPSFKG